MEKLYRQATALQFRTRISADIGTVLLPNRAYETLDQLLFLLRATLRKVQTQSVALSSPTSSDSRARSSVEPVSATGYSQADNKLFDLIGREKFTALTNPELWKRFRRQAEKELRRPMLANSFRASVNRIRKYCRLPSSREIRKSDQSS